MRYIRGLRCINCNHLNEVSIIYKCENCSGILNVEYNYEKIKKDSKKILTNKGIWKFKKLLPVRQNIKPVTLGEGETPLLEIDKIISKNSKINLFFKVESINPTLSFKDRSLSVALTVSKQFQVDKVITASTGNTGVAAAAYAARASMPCTIFIPKDTPKEKLKMMKLYGADTSLVDGNFSDAYQKANQIAMKNNWFNLTSTFLNPYAIEGNKTLAYELYEQYGGVPDWIIIPVGAGPLLVSCYKGFKELKYFGLINNLPKMVGVQAEKCSPIVEAFNLKTKNVSSWKMKEKTIASGIADPLELYPEDGTRTLDTIYESGGEAISVTENQIKYYQKLLAEAQGLFVEPSSVTAVAAIDILTERNKFDYSKQSIVSVLTGHGIKDLDVLFD